MADHTPAPVHGGLYAGDVGTLPMDTRLALCKLLSGPYINQDSPHWPAVLRDEVPLRSRLSDVFLELVLDRDRKVAFTRQADTGELDTPILLRSTPLSYLESVLLLHLRQVLVDAENQGLRAAVDEAEIIEHLELYTPAGGDRVAAQKRISAAIDKMKKNTILQAIRGAERRYEVSPTLRLLFNADDVQTMAAAYRALAGHVEHAESEDAHAID
jgi:hypothetical protein